MDELWEAPGPEAAEAIRSVARQLLADAREFTDALARPASVAQDEPALMADASLMEEDRELTGSELVQFLTSMIQHPGRRVAPYVGPRTTAYIADLAARGIRPDFAAGWRAGLQLGWRRWLEAALALDLARGVLAEVLHVSAQAMMQYALDCIEERREVNLAATLGNGGAEALAMIQLIASGAPVAQDLAEGRLNYRLRRDHLGLVLWTDAPDREPGGDLDEAVSAIRATVRPRCSLVARGSATSRWVWLSGDDIPGLTQLERLCSGFGATRVAVGRPGAGLDGFGASHRDALAAQAVILRLGSPRRFTSYAAVDLVDALTQDRASARRFVLTTLGPLVHGEPVLREALLAYVQSGFNTTQTAATLYAHRNTVERRVSRANELSAVSVEDNPTHVAAALMVLELAPGLVEAD